MDLGKSTENFFTCLQKCLDKLLIHELYKGEFFDDVVHLMIRVRHFNAIWLGGKTWKKNLHLL